MERKEPMKEIKILVEEISCASEDLKNDKDKRAKFITNQLNNMSEEQLTRFEFFIRSHFDKITIRNKIVQTIRERDPSLIPPNGMLNEEIPIIVCGLSKLFVGEIMDIATQVWRERKRSGLESTSSVTLDHLNEAYRRMSVEGKVGSGRESFFSSSWMTGDGNGDIFEDEEVSLSIDSEAKIV